MPAMRHPRPFFLGFGLLGCVMDPLGGMAPEALATGSCMGSSGVEQWGQTVADFITYSLQWGHCLIFPRIDTPQCGHVPANEDTL